MAITKMLNIKAGKNGNYEHLKNAIPYATNPDKTSQGILTGAYNCLPETAYQQMIMTKEKYDKSDKRVAYHFIVSFPKKEVTPLLGYQVVDEFVREYLSERYETVFGIHEDKEHIHGHIVFNSVSFVDGKKYHYKKGDWRKQIQPIVNRLCRERGLITVDLNKKGKRKKHYGEWKADKSGKVTELTLMKEDVDYCIQKAKTYGEFIRLLGKNGYIVKTGAHISLRIKGKDEMKPRRICSCFGEEYLPENIKERIQKESLPKLGQDIVQSTPRIKCVEGFSYKRANLTPYQKRYYRKLYMTGKMRKKRYSDSWKYRDDILRLNQLQEQFRYVWKHNIQSVQDFNSREKELKGRYLKLEEEREVIYQERRDKGRELKKLEEYLECKHRAELFKTGAGVYEEEYKRLEELRQFFKDSGTTVEALLEFRSQSKLELNKIADERKSIRQELALCKRTKEETLDLVKQVPDIEIKRGKDKKR